MAGAGGKNGDIAGTDCDFVAVFAAEHQPCRSGDEPQHLMRGRVVVVIVVHAVAPLRRPAIAGEECFAGGGGIVAPPLQHAAIQ